MNIYTTAIRDKIWVRPKEMFDGVVEREGQTIKRFTEISKEEAYEK